MEEKVDVAKLVARRNLKEYPRKLFAIDKKDMMKTYQRIAKKLKVNQERRDQCLRLARIRFVGKP